MTRRRSVWPARTRPACSPAQWTGSASELLDTYAAGDDLWLASSALMIGGPGRSEEKLERAVAGFRKLGDRWGLNEALLNLASLRAARGAPTDDLIAGTWSLTGAWVSGDEAIHTLVRLADLRARGGDLDGAGADLARARAGVDDETGPYARLQLGQAEALHACRRGDLDQALERYRSLFAVLPEVVPVVPFTVMLHTSYGRAPALSGDVDAAMEQHRVALDRLGRRNQDRPLLSMVLAGFGLAEQARGDQERAAVLSGASAAVEPPDDLPETAEGTRVARAALGEERFAACFARGAALSWRELSAMVA